MKKERKKERKREKKETDEDIFKVIMSLLRKIYQAHVRYQTPGVYVQQQHNADEDSGDEGEEETGGKSVIFCVLFIRFRHILFISEYYPTKARRRRRRKRRCSIVYNEKKSMMILLLLL